jgi:hypothetical protein
VLQGFRGLNLMGADIVCYAPRERARPYPTFHAMPITQNARSNLGAPPKEASSKNWLGVLRASCFLASDWG